MARGVFFSSHDGGCGAGKSSGCGKLLALAEFSGELDHDNTASSCCVCEVRSSRARSAASWAAPASTRLRRTVFPRFRRDLA